MAISFVHITFGPKSCFPCRFGEMTPTRTQYTVVVRTDAVHELNQYNVVVRFDAVHELNIVTVVVRSDAIDSINISPVSDLTPAKASDKTLSPTNIHVEVKKG